MESVRTVLGLTDAQGAGEALRRLVATVSAHSGGEVRVLYSMADHAVGGERDRDDLVRRLQAS
jgi:hypothetical protein